MAKKFFDIIPPEKVESSSEKLEFQNKTEPLLEDIEKRSSFKRIFLKGLIFCLVFLILIGISSYFFFSKVEVDIWPELEILTFEEKIMVDLSIENPDFKTKVIPGKVFSDQRFASEEFPATGRVLKKGKASGVIRVYNTYSTSSRTLIPSRFVSADGKLFWSVKKVVIPGARYEKGKLIPGEIDVEVEAAEPGPDYNIGSSSFALPALAGTSSYTTVYGKSFSPMTGGFEGEASQVTQEDLEKAEKVLTEKLKKESMDSLKSTLPADFVLLDETLFQEIVEVSSSVESETEAELFNFQIKLKSEAVGFRKSDLKDFAKNCINLDIPEDKKIQEESLEIDYSSESINLELGKIVLNLDIKTKVYLDIDLDKLKKALLGQPLKEARVFLGDLLQVNKIEIKSWPFLKRKIPEDINKMEVKLRLDPVK